MTLETQWPKLVSLLLVFKRVGMHKTQAIKEKIVERYSSLVDNSDQFTNAVKKPLKQTFRINSIKGNKDKILNEMVNYDASIKKISWYDNAFETDLTNLEVVFSIFPVKFTSRN